MDSLQLITNEIKKMNDIIIVEMVNEIYDWKKSGSLPKDSKFLNFCKKHNMFPYDMENIFLSTIAFRYQKFVIQLMESCGFAFFKNIK